MRPFHYSQPETIDEAIALLDQDARLLAGGTDLLTLMKGDIVSPAHLIDIKRLADLDDRIEMVEGGVSIGALATLTELEHDPLIQMHLPALREAAALAATPQLRNMATLGGNLLQRPRCWYYRNEQVHCWLKGGETCFAREGDNRYHALFDTSPCVAVHPSDLAPVLVAYGATVHYRIEDDVREIGIEDFFQSPTPERRTESVLPEDAVITRITVPMTADGTRSRYLKAMDRKVWAFALVGVAALIVVDEGTIRDARVVLGGVANVPWRARAAEDVLIGAPARQETFTSAAQIAVAQAQPLAHNRYKVPLLEALIRRALEEAA